MKIIGIGPGVYIGGGGFLSSSTYAKHKYSTIRYRVTFLWRNDEMWPAPPPNLSMGVDINFLLPPVFCLFKTRKTHYAQTKYSCSRVKKLKNYYNHKNHIMQIWNLHRKLNFPNIFRLAAIYTRALTLYIWW